MGWAGGDRRAGMAAAAGAGWARPARRWEGSAEEVAARPSPSLLLCGGGTSPGLPRAPPLPAPEPRGNPRHAF